MGYPHDYGTPHIKNECFHCESSLPGDVPFQRGNWNRNWGATTFRGRVATQQVPQCLSPSDSRAFIFDAIYVINVCRCDIIELWMDYMMQIMYLCIQYIYIYIYIYMYVNISRCYRYSYRHSRCPFGTVFETRGINANNPNLWPLA